MIRALLGTALFLLLAPGVVAGLVPCLPTHSPSLPFPMPLRVVGVLLAAAGTVFLLHSFARFALEGVGTPAPIAPTKRLVVGGVYRQVRNPMYLSVLAVILGQALLLGQLALLGYGIVVAAVFVGFVRLYEEPTLRRDYGAEYEAYRKAVPGWVPRLTPWRRAPSDEP